jgi:hypothetical protein
MTVQIFRDPADQCFMVVGSPGDTRPDQVVQEIRSRCRLFSIKLVFIAPCGDPDLWLRTLASINSYLKPGFELMGSSQAGAIFSNDVMANPFDPLSLVKLQKQMNNHPIMMQTVSNVLRMLHDTSKGIVGNIR